MQNDKTTLNDLSVFSLSGNEPDIFSIIDNTTTVAGREMLRKHILQPPATFQQLKDTQDAIRFLSQHPHLWPKIIRNGTLVMLDQYFESAGSTAVPPGAITLLLGSLFQKLLNQKEYSIQQFTLSHVSDFLKGCMQLAEMGDMEEVPKIIKNSCNAIKEELQHRLTEQIINVTKETKYPELVRINFSARREMKGMMKRLMSIYASLDALQSMAYATKERDWTFPILLPGSPVCFAAEGLYHPLLQSPVSYNTVLKEKQNFLVLTGANMAGKTTFLRALGVSAFLAHLGMGVPANSLKISFLGGIITNMYVEDSILKGESYFLAEVLRMKLTAEKLRTETPHMVLMDELFKGTNVHDAYECTKAVIECLMHQHNHLIVLSTHLYEVAKQFEIFDEIQFAYFVTKMNDDESFQFTYQLNAGISNDRIGYRILQKEGIIELLQRK